jgi:cold shock CspA family protein
MNTGVIKALNQKGFGFIKVEGLAKDIFFHASELRGVKFDELQVDQTVYFEEIEQSAKGQTAINVTI